MPTAPTIQATNLKTWTNRHETFQQKIDNLYDVINGNTGNVLADYNATTRAVADFIDKAIQQKKTLRILGGGWSFTKVATTKDWMLNTKSLNLRFTVPGENIAQSFKGPRESLLFAQCGNSIKEINDFAQRNGRSLPTAGASNGQTIVGAFATGTHGSTIDFGSTPDFIVAIHLVLDGGRHIWLERASYPVASEVLLKKLNTRLVPDDELFNAALVSFGCFGFIHGVMIQTEPVFLLECYRQRFKYTPELKNIMSTLDFSKATLPPYGSERPFHFQAVANPYDVDDGFYVTTMYKRPYRTDYPRWIRTKDKAGPGDDVPAFLGGLTAALPVVSHLVVDNLVKSVYTLYGPTWGTLGEVFDNTDARGRIISIAIGIPIVHVPEVHQLLMDINGTRGPFAGVFSYRYIKQSAATLAFAQFPSTCVVELDGCDSAISNRFCSAVYNELITRNIPHAFHWGKTNPLTAARVRALFPGRRERWINARNKLMSPALIEAFNNQVVKEWGLDEVLGRHA